MTSSASRVDELPNEVGEGRRARLAQFFPILLGI